MVWLPSQTDNPLGKLDTGPAIKKIIQKSNLNYGWKRLGHNPVNTQNKVRGKWCYGGLVVLLFLCAAVGDEGVLRWTVPFHWKGTNPWASPSRCCVLIPDPHWTLSHGLLFISVDLRRYSMCRNDYPDKNGQNTLHIGTVWSWYFL